MSDQTRLSPESPERLALELLGVLERVIWASQIQKPTENEVLSSYEACFRVVKGQSCPGDEEEGAEPAPTTYAYQPVAQNPFAKTGIW